MKEVFRSLKSHHLQSVGQAYAEHFSDSMTYSLQSLKSSFYFFCHALYPDCFETSGSRTIAKLNSDIGAKCQKMHQHINTSAPQEVKDPTDV